MIGDEQIRARLIAFRKGGVHATSPLERAVSNLRALNGDYSGIMGTRMTVIRVGLAAVLALAGSALALAAPVLWLAFVDPFGGSAHPSDATLLAQFAAKRPALEQLVDMIDHDDGLVRVAADFTRPDDGAGVSPDRIALYRQRLVEAGIADGLSDYGGAIVFLVHARGLSIGGSAKGFAFAEGRDPAAIVVDGDLDAAVATLPDKNVLLRRRIDGDWWLQLDRR